MRCSVFIGFFIIGLCLAEVPEIPDLDDLEDLKDRCNTKGGPGTFEKVKTAKTETETCLKKLIDIEKFKDEIEEAKKTGSMDEVFAKYCKKRPEMKDCIKKTYNAIEPCLEENEKRAINFTSNIITELGDFVCAKDGDRLAMFVAEGGVACLKSRLEGIKECINQTLKFNPATFSPDSIHTLTIDETKCDELKTVQGCIVKDLEDNCDETTPANIIDALFRFVRKTACKDVKQRRSISLRRQLRSALWQSRKSLSRNDVYEKLEALCKKNGNEKSFEKLQESSTGIMICLSSYKLFTTPINIFEDALVRCTAEWKKVSKECLSEDEKYFPDFILFTLQKLLRFAYENSDFIQGKSVNWEHATCLSELHRKETENKIRKCFEVVTEGQECKKEFFIPPKPELCKQTKSFTSCFRDIIKNICIRDIKTEKFVDGIISAVESPCVEETDDNGA